MNALIQDIVRSKSRFYASVKREKSDSKSEVKLQSRVFGKSAAECVPIAEECRTALALSRKQEVDFSTFCVRASEPT